jgi:hypothetical protein
MWACAFTSLVSSIIGLVEEMKGGKGHQVREGEEEHQARECACPHFVPRVESVSRGCCAAATYLRLVHLADQGPPVGHIIVGPAVRQGVRRSDKGSTMVL